MGQRWFIVAVTVMWMTSMGWLVSTKLWPLLWAGTPPSNLTVYTQQSAANGLTLPPVGWTMSWGSKPLGWAVSSSSVNSEGFTTIQSHAHFDRIPFEELLPIPFQPLMSKFGSNREIITMEAESRLIMDANGHLNRMSFIITMPALQKPIRVEGYVKNDKFIVTLFPGTGDRFSRWELPADAVIGNDLTPLVRLPDLYLEQTWNVRVYNHFGIGTNSRLEMLQAKVERSDMLHWEETDRPVWLVVMRRDAGSLLGHIRPVRGKMWVDYDGTVLQQESYLNNSRLTFTRVKDSRAQEFQQASKAIRQRRLRDFDAVEFDPKVIPEDKIDVFSVNGTENGKEDNSRSWNGRSYRGQHGAWRDGYHRRREGDIWDQVAPLAEPHRIVDPSDQIVDPFVLPEEQRQPSVPRSKAAGSELSPADSAQP
jgi:hypothetical protein